MHLVQYVQGILSYKNLQINPSMVLREENLKPLEWWEETMFQKINSYFVSFHTYFPHIVSFWFHAKMFNCTVPDAIATISAATHGRFRQSRSQSINCIYLSSPAYYNYLTSAKGLKMISAKFRPRQDSNQERATRLTPTRAMAPLRGELWQV